MLKNNQYYRVPKPKKNLDKVILDFLLFIVKIPATLPRWIVSFLASRHISHLTINSTGVKNQRQIHLHSMSNSPEEDLVVVNLSPANPWKIFKDLVLKFSSSIFRLPFMASIQRNKLEFDNPQHKAYVDRSIAEITALIEGTSNAQDCEGRQFQWEQIHFKGMEFFDSKMTEYFHQELEKKHGPQAFQADRTHHLNFFSLETPDGSVLDSVSVADRAEETKPIACRKFIISCMAQGQNYGNWLKDFNASAKEIGCTVIGFNYRGIDRSKGMIWTQENMIEDVLAQVRHLISQGVKPSNIGIEGMCVGGAVATLAAARLHAEGIKVKLYNERSFRSIVKLIVGHMFPDGDINYRNPLTYLGFIAVGIVYMIVAPIVWLAGWHMDAASAWDRIPAEDKEYSLVRNPGNIETGESPVYDGILNDQITSLASYIEEKHASLSKKQKTGGRLTKEEECIVADAPQNHYFTPSPEGVQKKARWPHILPRKLLFFTGDAAAAPLTAHQHMIASFKDKFSRSFNNTVSESYSEDAEGENTVSLAR